MVYRDKKLITKIFTIIVFKIFFLVRDFLGEVNQNFIKNESNIFIRVFSIYFFKLLSILINIIPEINKQSLLFALNGKERFIKSFILWSVLPNFIMFKILVIVSFFIHNSITNVEYLHTGLLIAPFFLLYFITVVPLSLTIIFNCRLNIRDKSYSRFLIILYCLCISWLVGSATSILIYKFELGHFVSHYIEDRYILFVISYFVLMVLIIISFFIFKTIYKDDLISRDKYFNSLHINYNEKFSNANQLIENNIDHDEYFFSYFLLSTIGASFVMLFGYYIELTSYDNKVEKFLIYLAEFAK